MRWIKLVISGSNNITVQAAPNSAVIIGISEKEMRELLRDKSIAANRELSDKYPLGYVLLGAVNGKIIFEPNFKDITIEAHWPIRVHSDNTKQPFWLYQQTSLCSSRSLALLLRHAHR